ncbi:hypothetical protein BGP77_12195 [Saccharospirillum sp. MSK14-1]|uniref:hypothetical protein n=1 Tax=Saccharospirillum sp. MSK14-1 TaxID=1897632 RepID=UPI000D3C91AB|nr:hypothetical protein [Saccharospirillum sp. MSK14-1]PTY38462.1 hypothetical protein BGP77_12195 [Saccharospirillum sp. MSK14-1]
MEAPTFFTIIVKCLVLLALAMTFVRTLGHQPKPQRQPWWQQRARRESRTLVAPRLDVQFTSSQQLSFEWHDVTGATHYQLLERPGPNSVFQPVGAVISAGREKRTINRPLHARLNTQYVLRAFSANGFADSAALSVGERLMVKLNYLQQNNIDPTAYFGFSVTQSAGGRTLIIADSDQASLGATDSHCAAYVFLRDMKGQWNKLAYMRGDKANEQSDDLSSCEPYIEAPELSPAESPILPSPWRKRRGFRVVPSWQDAARNLRWMNFNSP